VVQLLAGARYFSLLHCQDQFWGQIAKLGSSLPTPHEHQYICIDCPEPISEYLKNIPVDFSAYVTVSVKIIFNFIYLYLFLECFYIF
jgi:hypothetical protein